MIGPGAGARVMVATRPVDFRKGPDALAALVAAEYGGDPWSGVIYVFRAKRSDRIKLVWWDGTGLCLMCQTAFKRDPRLEWAPWAGQGHAADLTMSREFCCSNCAGLT